MPRKLLGVIAALALCCAALVRAQASAMAQSEVVGWGSQVVNSAWNHEAFVAVAAGEEHTVALRSNGSVVAWGGNQFGECNVPDLPAGITYSAIAAGLRHTVALRSDGSVVAWGNNQYGECNVPSLP